MSAAGAPTDPSLLRRWFPLCAPVDLSPRHVLEAGLLGRDLAAWRSSDGRANVWENRCPHRGLRLTLGANLGDTLRCAYHGYRFATGSGGCTLVPAEPGRSPPASLRVLVYPVLEREGLLWTRLSGAATPVDAAATGPPWLPSDSGPATTLYPIPVRAPAWRVAGALAQYLTGAARGTGEATALDAFCVESVALRDGSREVVRLHVRPVDADCAVIHGVLLGGLDAQPPLAALRHHAARLSALRRALECGAPQAAGAACGP